MSAPERRERDALSLVGRTKAPTLDRVRWLDQNRLCPLREVLGLRFVERGENAFLCSPKTTLLGLAAVQLHDPPYHHPATALADLMKTPTPGGRRRPTSSSRRQPAPRGVRDDECKVQAGLACRVPPLARAAITVGVQGSSRPEQLPFREGGTKRSRQ